jgi:hypothetical protein
MRLRHQLAQVQAQAYTTLGASARGVGAEEGLGQVGKLVLGNAGSVVTHLDADA